MTRTNTDAATDRYLAPLRARLGLTDPPPARVRMWGWVATAIATTIAFITRFIGLTHPRHITFDETYYVKGGYSLITHGYERDWVGDSANQLFLQGSEAALSVSPDRVVHPPLGKWLIGWGQMLFGADNGAGWRFSTALVGVIAVFLMCRIAFRFFRSAPLTLCAGLFLALDGVAIVMSRVSILDNHVMIFTFAGFWAVLKDRDWSREKLALAAARNRAGSGGSLPSSLGPGARASGRLVRPWLILAGLFIGLGCGVKWSSGYALAVFGILVYAWDTGAYRAIGTTRWVSAGILRGGLPAFANFVPIALLGYVGTWTSWFLDERSYKRGWAEAQRKIGETVPFESLGDALAEWIAYHREMMEFHLGLSSEHSYQSQPWQWIIQHRPVSFYWPSGDKIVQDCGAERCVQAITSIGNPAVWWLAIPGLLIVIYLAVRRTDWRAWAILAGYAAMYLPWFQYTDRTIFQFYSVAFVPYVVLALTMGMAWACGGLRPDRLRISTLAQTSPPNDGSDMERSDGAVPEADAPATGRSTGPAPAESEGPASTSADPAASPRSASPAAAASDSDVQPQVTPSPSADLGGAGSTETASEEDTELLSDNESAEPTRPPVDDFGRAEEYLTNWTASMSSGEKFGYISTGAAVVLFAAFWFPLWTGWTVPYDFWRMHMWLPSWT